MGLKRWNYVYILGIIGVVAIMGISPDSVSACSLYSDLIAGQTIDIGHIEILHNSWTTDVMTIRYYLDEGNGWYMEESHLAVATSLSGIPHTNNGNPKIGKFPYKTDYDPVCRDHTYTIDLDNYLTKDSSGEYHGTLYFAIHASVVREITVYDSLGVPSTYTQQETAWGDTYGIPFNDSGWAMYIVLTF